MGALWAWYPVPSNHPSLQKSRIDRMDPSGDRLVVAPPTAPSVEEPAYQQSKKGKASVLSLPFLPDMKRVFGGNDEGGVNDAGVTGEGKDGRTDGGGSGGLLGEFVDNMDVTGPCFPRDPKRRGHRNALAHQFTQEEISMLKTPEVIAKQEEEELRFKIVHMQALAVGHLAHSSLRVGGGWGAWHRQGDRLPCETF